jgi:acyl-CoA synthetase (NDP forming)
LAALAEAQSDKPVLFAGLDQGAAVPQEIIDALRAAGVPYFPSPERALRAVRRLNNLTAGNLATSDGPMLERLALPAGPAVVPEYRAKQLLGPLGVTFPAGRFATTLEEALAAAEALGYPVVLKAQSPDLSHKSDAGGVVLSLGDKAQVQAGWRRLQDNIAGARPGLVLDGVLVEAMGARGVELILGARNDPEWGPIILAGFGGVQAEILHDVRLMTPDLTKAQILRELDALKSAPLLHGFRGSPALDVEAVAELIGLLSRVMLSNPSIREIDLNPVVVYPQGQGAIALDALMTVESPI